MSRVHIIYAVVITPYETSVSRMEMDCPLPADQESILEICRKCAEHSALWNDVLEGHLPALIFDGDTGDRISINTDEKPQLYLVKS